MKMIDYIHYYFGCQCVEAIKVPGQELNFEPSTITVRTLFNVQSQMSEVKLVLRRLEDMTEEERVEIFGKDVHWYKPFDANDACDIQQWHKLLQKGFDLFGLIDASIAIDAKTITQ
jgi:hypothetical protein